jgi:hypothetical protein
MDIFKKHTNAYYYVDKTLMIHDLIERLASGDGKYSDQNYICITRPRRFGKSMMIATLGAYFSKGCDSNDLFKNLKIFKTPKFDAHLNKHNVIYMDFSHLTATATSCEAFIHKVAGTIATEVNTAWPSLHAAPKSNNMNTMIESAINSLNNARKQERQKFIFLIDEWDAPLQKTWMRKEEDKLAFFSFMRTLLKDRAYVDLAYMTGVLPIPSYSNTSALNMFGEYRLGNDTIFSEYFGFTPDDAKDLIDRYCKEMKGKSKNISPE